MKTKRVKLPNNATDQQKIVTYLTSVYNKKNLFDTLKKSMRKAEESEGYRTNNVIKEAVISSYPDNTWGFFLYLAMGQKEAAYYLAASFIDGLGAKLDDDLASLAMAIGIKLGDKQSKKLAGNEKFKDIKALTDQCVEQIKKNAKEIGNKEITCEEAIGRAKLLDHIVKTKLNVSFEENILEGSIKGYAKFVAVEGIPYYEMECGASTSAHDTSADSGLHDTSFDEGNVAMAGESSHHYPHH